LKLEKTIVKKPMNVDIISAKTIEALLRFLGIEPEDTRAGLDNKFNKVRIEV